MHGTIKIKVNETALEERKGSLFSWQHPLIELNGISIRLFNIRPWNEPTLFHRNQYK